MRITDILPFKTACSLCLSPNRTNKLGRDKRGKPYYRCEACNGITFLHTPLQAACFAIVHEGLASKDVSNGRAQAISLVESCCMGVLRKSPAEVTVSDLAAAATAEQKIPS